MAEEVDKKKELEQILKRIAQTEKGRIVNLQEEVQAYKDSIAATSDLYIKQQAINSLREAEAELARETLMSVRKKVVQGEKLNEEQIKYIESLGVETDEHGKNLEQIEEKIKGANLQIAAQQSLNKKLSESGPLTAKVQLAAAEMAEALEQGKLATFAMNRANNALERGYIGFLRSVKNLVLEVNKASKGFERATGNIFGPSVTKQVQQTYKELNEYGVSADQAYNAQLGLSRVVTDFTTFSATQQSELRESALLFEQLGASADSYFKGIQNSIKFFSMTPQTAEKATREIYATSEALGMVPADLLEKYAAMGPVLAKFGNEGKRAFKDLARIQKITGFEMEKVLQITNRFDTFEGAAQQAGQLNAALGGNFVNAMDLMTATDPAERFMMIRDALEQTGLSFDEMSYYQKQFYTNSLGLSDVGELAQIMSGDMNSFGDSVNRSAKEYADMRENAQNVQNVQEAFTNIIRNNADSLVSLADSLSDFTALLLRNEHVIKSLVYGYIALKTITLAVNGARAAGIVGMKTANILTAIGTKLGFGKAASKKAETMSDIENTVQKDINTQSQIRNNAATGAGITTFLKAGAAVALFGIGIGVAAMGMADLISAFETAGWKELSMAGVTLAAVAAGAFFMAKGVAALGASGKVATVGLLTVAGSIALIGAGIGFAAMGVASLVEELGKLSGPQLVQVGAGLIGFAGAVGILAGALVLLSNPVTMTGALVLAGLGATVGIIGKALGLFGGGKTDSFKKMVPVLDSMSSVKSQQFKAAESAFKSMQQSINGTKADQLDSMKSMINATALLATTPMGITMAPMIASAVMGREATRATPPSTAAADTTTQKMQFSLEAPIQLEIGGDKLDRHILKITGDARTGRARAALKGQGTVIVP